VARVAVDTPLPHLDRHFDYLVPASLGEVARPGVRVRVRFAGRLMSGLLLQRRAEAEHDGRLSPLAAVVSAEPVLTDEVLALCRALALHGAGTLSDVLRLAVPPRHARVEAVPAGPPAAPPPPPAADALTPYQDGTAVLRALAGGGAPRVVWSALPGPGWAASLAAAVQACLASGRGAVLVVPDAGDLARADAALTAALGPGRHVALTAGLGPPERYRRWLRVLRGEVLAVVGTRAAAFAPVRDLGLVAVWDDGDDSLAEPRAPYPHARDVLVRRAHLAGAGAVIGGWAPSVEAVGLLGSRWAQPLAAPREVLRARWPRVQPLGGDAELARDPAAQAARLPSLAFAAAREALAAGRPVLVQVPRRGYHPGLACASCRSPARCAQCAGPLAREGSAETPACRWCGRPATAWACRVCASTQLRPVVVGDRRTAEELGRAFPGVPVRASAGDHVLDEVPDGPQLVVATPGAEPVAPGEGYSAALLLDGWALLGRPDLRAAEEALRRWCAAVGRCAPGARVIVSADASLPVVQALVRGDPVGYATREAAERAALHFPPGARMAALIGAAAAVAAAVEGLVLPAGGEVLGPTAVPGTDDVRAIVRVPRAAGRALAAELARGARERSARKVPGSVRMHLDPLDVG